ncbi:uncharacterized protein [Haliotis cracherodii]|uniref:uncharacterized protein n=1 Tax=Haliotis cracherodii TaxID=6455 RepID=UPI0039E8617E
MWTSLPCVLLIPVIADVAYTTTCYRKVESLTITLFCSYGCCSEEGTTVCCDRAAGNSVSLFSNARSAAAVAGMIVAMIFTVCIIIAVVCCVKKTGLAGRIGTHTNVSVVNATIPSAYPSVAYTNSHSTMVTSGPVFQGYPSPSVYKNTFNARPPCVTAIASLS